MYKLSSTKKSRPKSIRIYNRRALNSDYEDLIIPKKPEFISPSLFKPKNQNKPIVHKSYNKSIQSNLDFVVNHIQTQPNPSGSASEESSPLFYLAEPRFHTSIPKKRSETPKPDLVKMKKMSWMFKYSKKTKWQSLSKEVKFDAKQTKLQKPVPKGKVHKGLCEYPNLVPSPVRLHNIKLCS